MPILFTKLILGEVKTISIPTDTIFIISLLIIFVLIVSLFNKIISNQTTQLSKKTDFDGNLALEDYLTFQPKILDKKNVEKPINEKLDLKHTSKFLGISSLAFFALGGASLMGLQHIQKSYQGMNASRTNIKLENKSKKLPLSIVEKKSLDKTHSNRKQIKYIDPLLQTMRKSKANHFYQVKEQQKESNFSF